MEKYTFSGKTEEEALEAALSELSLEKNDIIYEAQEQKGGLFKGKKVEISVTKKSDINEYIKSVILKIVTDMGFDAKIESKVRDEQITIKMYSDNNNILIGKEGKTLQALTTVVKQVIFNKINSYPYILLDVENYKDKQEQRLVRLAKNVAREVAKSKVPAELENMNSYQRRIIHNALGESNKVYTESVGEEPNRHIVIKPKEAE